MASSFTTKKSTNASSLGESLRLLLRNLEIETKVKEHMAAGSWSQIVGEAVAKISEVDRVEDGVLFVKVESSSWRNELAFMRREIISKINTMLGEEIIHEIRFK